MSDDELLICRTYNRDLFEAWQAGEITFDEGVFIARRDRFLKLCLTFGVPVRLLHAAGLIYDLLFLSAATRG